MEIGTQNIHALRRFWTAKELAEELRCSEGVIRKWQKEGMPSISLGRLRRFHLDAALAWLQQRSRESCPAK